MSTRMFDCVFPSAHIEQVLDVVMHSVTEYIFALDDKTWIFCCSYFSLYLHYCKKNETSIFKTLLVEFESSYMITVEQLLELILKNLDCFHILIRFY